MYKIILICTQHIESGNCNSAELLNIIEKIEPEVIFEELSPFYFDEIYEQKRLISLESDAIKEYLKNHKVHHIPVDTYPIPDNYDEETFQLFFEIYNNRTLVESRVIRNLMDDNMAIIHQRGFEFLNSDENDEYFEKIYTLKEKVMDVLNDENLFRIHKLEGEINAKREYEIIKNVYDFSSENQYETAIMFIGSGHRKTIFELIQKFELMGKIKLNWKNFISQ